MNYKDGRSTAANRKQYLRDYNRKWRKRNPDYFKKWKAKLNQAISKTVSVHS